MRDYIIILSCVGVFCGIVHILAPKGEGDGLRGNVRLISALAVLCIAVYPVGDFLITLKDAKLDLLGSLNEEDLKEKYEADFVFTMQKYSDESVEEKCKSILMERFDMRAEDLDIEVYSGVENDNIKIDSADIIIYFGGITKDPDKLSDTLSDILKCECRIIYK